MFNTRLGATLLAFFGVGCVVTGVARLASTRGLAVFLTSAAFGFLALLMAGQKLLDTAGRPSEPGGRRVQGTLLAIAAGSAVAGVSVVWRAFTEPVAIPVRVLFTFGGACLLYGSFGAVVGVLYQSTRRA
ncbi:MAG TPA: hypothetical protein VNT52_10335 [Acidimicrobiales bacterium]|nr:hypothetical protein [Acidimicrobiales bacterium]